jgi:hypothetical protein
MKISRRSFLKSSAATTAAMAIPGGIVSSVVANQASTAMTAGPGNKWPGRVVVNFNKNAVTGTTTPTIVVSVVKQMVDDSILKLTGETTIGAAWKALFPSTLTAQSKIAIKVYSATPKTPSHWQGVKAITDGLQQMDFNGTKFSADNISIYEGMASNRHSEAGFTAANLPGIKIEYWGRDKFGDGTGNEAAGAIKDRPYSPTLKNADFLINAFNPHGHEAKYGSFSIGFKNHYGSYDLYKPSDIHTNPEQHLRDMNCTGPIFKKTVLSTCIGLVACNESVGPMTSPDDYSTYSKAIDPTSTCKHSTTIIMSTDPISCEMQTIKMMRMNKGGKYGISDMPKYLQASGGVSGALTGTNYNIGIIDEAKMDIRRITNGATSIAEHPLHREGLSSASLKVSPLSGFSGTFIEYRLPAQHIGQESSIAIHSVNGALIRKESLPVLGALNHFSWDHKDRSGNRVPAGNYIVQVKSVHVSLSERFTIAP